MENHTEQQVKELLSNEDYYGAWHYASTEAAAGNADAMCVLGDLYYNGLLVDKDVGQAALLYYNAARANSPRGNFEYAIMCENGEGGISASEEEVVTYYLRSAELGYDRAQFEMGRRYSNGDGVPRNLEKAFYMYCCAGENGNCDAQFCVGLSYIDGSGTQIDYFAAMDWLRKAAYQGDSEAMVFLGGLLAALKPEFDYEPTNEMYREALLWLNKAADKGEADAHFLLAIMYADGIGVEQHGNKAYYHLKIAAETGNKDASNLIKRFKRNIYGEYYFS